MAYVAVTNGEIATDQPITTGLMTKYRDNQTGFNDGTAIANDAIKNSHIADNAIQQLQMADSSIGHAELRRGIDEADITSQTITPLSTLSNTVILTDPTYYMGMRWSGSCAGADPDVVFDCFYGASRIGTDGDLGTVQYEVKSQIEHTDSTGNRTVQLDCDTYHIISSPPYDMGDGEVPLFIFARYNKDHEIISLMTTRTPPWVYNGPTRASPEYYKKGVGFYKKKSIDEQTGEITVEEVEITSEIQHADMDIFPHPYRRLNDGDYIVLLDPVSTLQLLDYKESGVRISHLMSGDYLRLDNTPINRVKPNGIITSAFKWKNTQRKAGEMIQDKRLKQGPYAPQPPQPPEVS